MTEGSKIAHFENLETVKQYISCTVKDPEALLVSTGKQPMHQCQLHEVVFGQYRRIHFNFPVPLHRTIFLNVLFCKDNMKSFRREIVHVDHDKAKETVANASDTSDGELEAKGGRDQQQSIPNLSLLSASVFKSSESTQDMAPAINELSRSLSAPSSSGNSACVHKNAPSRSPAVALPETQIFGCEKNESFKNTSSYGTQISRGTMGGAVPSSHTVHQKAPRSISPRQAIHQPKRQHGGNHQTRKPHPEMKPCHQSTINDLIAVGTCKALYDFESSQYGETFLSFKSGDELKVISSGARWHGSVDAEGWIYAETIPSGEGNRNLPQRGFIPAGFVEIILYPEPLPLSPPRQHEPDDLASHRRVHGYGRTENAYLALGQATEL